MASVKVAPHLVDAATVDAGARLAGFGSHPLVWVAPFIPSRVGVLVKESVRSRRAAKFEASVRAKIEGLGSTIEAIEYVEDEPEAVEQAMAGFVRRPDPVDLILTAGAASTDPLDPCFLAITALGGRLVRRGVPAHPGSMLWLARIGSTAILGPADLRRLLEGDRRGPAPAAPAVGRGRHRADRRQARPRRHPDPQPAVPVPGLRPRAGRPGRLRRVGSAAAAGTAARGQRAAPAGGAVRPAPGG